MARSTSKTPTSSSPGAKVATTVQPGTEIIVRGARVHNLKNISVQIPHQQFVVITGPSGSGKSSLAFDTIHAEGQRLETQIRESLQSARLEALRVRDSQLAAAKTEAQEINAAAAAHAAREAEALKEELSKIRSRATADLEKEVESLANLLVSRVLEKPVNRVLH